MEQVLVHLYPNQFFTLASSKMESATPMQTFREEHMYYIVSEKYSKRRQNQGSPDVKTVVKIGTARKVEMTVLFQGQGKTVIQSNVGSHVFILDSDQPVPLVFVYSLGKGFLAQTLLAH